ncbi:MAG: hypothetical protein Q8S84_07665 [bacterium]|nr:hypothetical protein [bacterium]MDP3381320.1 hypothetical protein [bacterium]
MKFQSTLNLTFTDLSLGSICTSEAFAFIACKNISFTILITSQSSAFSQYERIFKSESMCDLLLTPLWLELANKSSTLTFLVEELFVHHFFKKSDMLICLLLLIQ